MKDKVLQKLREKAEGTFITDQDGKTWEVVYLDNVLGDLAITPKQFSGYLSALRKEGLYRPEDQCFGEVLVTEPAGRGMIEEDVFFD